MRFKDYIVKRAIKINYDNIVDSEKKLTLLDNAVLSASTKLGYKLLDTIKSKKSIDILIRFILNGIRKLIMQFILINKATCIME